MASRCSNCGSDERFGPCDCGRRPEDVEEIEQLRAQLAAMTVERDNWRAAHATSEAVLAGDGSPDTEKSRVASTVSEDLKNAAHDWTDEASTKYKLWGMKLEDANNFDEVAYVNDVVTLAYLAGAARQSGQADKPGLFNSEKGSE